MSQTMLPGRRRPGLRLLGGGKVGSASRAHGFTLVEVLVSMLILAVLAATAWKGIDALSTARQVADGNLKETLRLQAVMTQMDADMGQVIDTFTIPAGALQFDGANLRLTRRVPTGIQVVVWFLRRGQLMRWASPPTTRVGDLEKYWISSFQLRGREPGTLVALKGVEQFQVYCFRNGSLSNCQSTGNLAAITQSPSSAQQQGQSPGGAPTPGAAAMMALTRQMLPQAIRAQLTLGEGSGFAGRLSRDIMLAPQMIQ